MSSSEGKKCSFKRKNVEPDFPKTTKHSKVENKTQPGAELSEGKKCSFKRKNVEPDFPKTTKHSKVENKTQPGAELSGGKKCSIKRKNVEPDFPTTTKHSKVENNENELEAEILFDCVKVSLEPAEREAFYMLLEDFKIKRFLQMDSTYKFSDQYFLAMVAIYFKKAKLTIAEYTRSNFFLALYLANLMEDDIPYYKEIISWAIGEKIVEGKKQFTDQLHRLLARIGFRARVTIEECLQIFSQDPGHWLWNRKRKPQNSCRPVSSYNRVPNELCLRPPGYIPQNRFICCPYARFPSRPFYIFYPPWPLNLLFPSGPSN